MSMGESTRRRLEGAVRGAAAGNAPGQYVGGWNGGLQGTWGKAGTGRNQGPGGDSPAAGPPARPASAGRIRPDSAAVGGGAGGGAAAASGAGAGASGGGYGSNTNPTSGVRERVRPASAGVKSAWNEAAKELPRAPPHGLSTGKVRTHSASMAKTTKHMAGLNTQEYKLQGTALGAGGGGGGGGGGGVASSGTFGTPPGVGRRGADPRGGADPYHANSVLEKSRRELAALRTMEASDGGPLVITEAHLAALEDALRDAVRSHRSVYEGSKEMLLRLFKAVDDGSGDVSIPEFCNVCAQVGVAVSPEEGGALFRRFGYDTVMPYEKFAHVLLTQPSRQLAEDMPVRKGAFQAGHSANFNGKIIYRHCRKPVYTPSDWDPALAERSADLPSARLVLEFVYGYQGHENTSQNLFYTSEGKLVYYTAGVGVVYQRPPIHHQYFFLGHSDDITSLAICRAAVDVDGRSYPERSIIATGQVTSSEEGAYISIWDSRVGSAPDGPAIAPELVRIKFDKEARGITALAFNPNGKWLVAVATDNQHTVYVYDWRKQRQLSNGKGQMGDPPQVYGVEWNPYEDGTTVAAAFLTFGRKHIKLWMHDAASGNWAAKSMSFGKQPMQNVTSAQWLPPRTGGECLVVAGMADGNLYVYKGAVCIKAIAAHRPGPQVIQADGHPAYNGVRGLRVCKDNKVLLSGGADGTVLQWDVSDGSLADARFAGPSMQLTSPFGLGDKYAPGIRALDYSPELDRIVVGTTNCDINELTPTTTETLMDGHSGDVYSLACHPAAPNLMATVADSGHVHVWDTATRQMTHCAAVGWTPRAVAYSTHPVASTSTYHLAIGGVKGQLKILDEGANLKPLHSTRDSKEGIHDLKYSPNGRFLAAACFDTWIDIYNVGQEYARVARCSGHSSTVRCIDWDVDSSVIQSGSADLELLHWNARTGKQITLPQRDTQMSTYTVYMGFPVMGVYPPFADGTEINAVDRSKDQQYCVTADDHGMVKLFNYPCVVEDAPHRAYRGHSSHVMGVRFNANNSLVCSVGGRDWAIFQFKLVHIQPDAPRPVPAKPVWGALDPGGKSYGYTTTPAQVTTPGRNTTALDDSPLQGSPALSGGAGSQGYGSGQGAGSNTDYVQGGTSHVQGGGYGMAPIIEEASNVSVASRVTDGGPRVGPTSPEPLRGGGQGGRARAGGGAGGCLAGTACSRTRRRCGLMKVGTSVLVAGLGMMSCEGVLDVCGL